MQTDRDHWEAVTFGDVVREVTDHERDPEERGLDRYVGLDHLDPGDLRIRRWGLISEGVTFTKAFQAGQVLFGKRRAYQKKAGVPDFDGLCSGDIIVLEVKDKRMLPEFLPYLVQTDAFFTHAEKTSSGSLSPRTKFRELARFEFLLPPLEQQHELMELMQGFEAAIEATEEVVGAAEQVDRQLLKGLFSATVNWKTQRLSDVAEARRGRTRSPRRLLGAGTTKYLRALNIRDGFVDFEDVIKMDFTEKEKITDALRKGDLLLVEGGESRDVGMCALFTDQADTYCFQDHVIRVRVVKHGEVLPEFLFQYFRHIKRSSVFANMGKGTKIQNISHLDVAALKIPTPSIDEQMRLLEKMEVSNGICAEVKLHLLNIRALRTSILNSILTPSASTPVLVIA